MYRVPNDLNLDPIIGCSLVQLCLGRSDVQLNFDDPAIRIHVESRITLLESSKVIATWNQSNCWSSIAFQKLLDATVIAIRVPNERTLEIEFDNNLVLQAHDDSDICESMQIHSKDGTFIV